MLDQARVVIVGGSFMRASILYRLIKLSCSDTIILEHPDRISGSTCYAAGGYAHGSSKSVAQSYVLKDITIDGNGWSIELLGQILPAKPQRCHLFDPNTSRIRS